MASVNTLQKLAIISVLPALMLLSGMCSRQEHPKPGDPGSKNHNLILITVDTLRADYLGIYGYPDTVSPNLDPDPDEEKNLVFKDRKLYKRMEALLENHIKTDLPNGLLGSDKIKFDSESLKMLKSLGYIK